jgi:UDP-hydrolysing UDP-N-acetyl-D-glucosamine 2-epimerase
MPRKRRVCFVTGTRAEFGLMQRTLRAIQSHPKLQLQIVATGMHLDSSRGRSLAELRRDKWRIDRVVRWSASQRSIADAAKGSKLQLARCTGAATSKIASALAELETDIVLIVGDRVEAFAAAVAGNLSGKAVAHVHGGDRALGQVDDALRHAITKLAHIHFPATAASAVRILRLGEDAWRIHRAGAPGIEGIVTDATSSGLPSRRCALLVLHPADADDAVEYRRAEMILRELGRVPFQQIVIVYPNNDPGSRGIVRCWQQRARGGRFVVHRNVARSEFLGMMRDAAVLIGNSSSGIIEAASFGTPVIDIGPRQRGREKNPDVFNVPYQPRAIGRALNALWNNGRPKRFKPANLYAGHPSRIIADVLATTRIDSDLLHKLIAY